EIASGDEPIVREHGNIGGVRELDALGHGGAVMRDNNERIDVPADQRLDILDLLGIAAVRRKIDDFGAELSGAFHKHVAIALPPFFLEGIHRQADERAAVAGARAPAWAISATVSQGTAASR